MDAADAVTEMSDQPGDGNGPTEELPVAGMRSGGAAGAAKPGGFVPGVAGVGLCVLWIMAVGLIVAQVVSAVRGQPGPGALAVGAHAAGALAGVGCYRSVSRGRGPARLLGLVALAVILALLLWFFWWSPAR